MDLLYWKKIVAVQTLNVGIKTPPLNTCEKAIASQFPVLPIFGIFEHTLIMMGKNTSISLGDHFEEFIKNEVKSGRYSSVSEVIRSALRLLEREEKKERELIKALETGEQSGFVEDFDPKQHLTELHRKHL